MGRMRIEKAGGGAAPSEASSRPASAGHALSPRVDNTAFDFGMKRASHANHSQSKATKSRRRREFTWMAIVKFKVRSMFGAHRDTMPGPGAPLPEHLQHNISRPASHAQTVM